MSSFLRLLSIVVLLLARAAVAADPTQDEARAIRAVVQAQLDAFKADDEKRAFSYASPGIQQQFGTAEHFMAMVRRQYAVVYRPASVAFLEPQRIDGQVRQPVRMTDAAGTSWLVLYLMEQQRDRSWRIAGCQATQQAVRTAASPRRTDHAAQLRGRQGRFASPPHAPSATAGASS
jgi:hypothetical protein